MSEVERIRPIVPAYGTVQRVDSNPQNPRKRWRQPGKEDVIELHETEEEAEIIVLEPKLPVQTTVHIDLEA